MNKLNSTFNLIMEGIKSGYPFGKLSAQEIKNRLPKSLSYCIANEKELSVNISIHSLSIKKSHGLHMIKGSHSQTFKIIDIAINNVLSLSSLENLYECIFNETKLLISFEKVERTNKIDINIINAFYLSETQFEKRKEEEFHIDSSGKKFKIIRIS